tara:strand:- start:129 stop:1322 length:1194 start_codon:yes stop_codon:yes gene_type:complete
MKVAFLTSGGIAPCLSSSIGRLMYNYSRINKNVEFIGYLNGYKGLLTDKKIILPNNLGDQINVLYSFGGTFLGNSRVKLTNKEDCVKKGYIKEDEDPLSVAALQLLNDNIDILHTIGGDDTNTTASDLVDYLKSKNHNLTVVGLPKTIDNDVYPISQTLGAYTAAEQSAVFFKNIVNENTTSSRQLIIHEVMGRNCGWLTAYSAFLYRKNFLSQMDFLKDLNLEKKQWDVHAIYIPEDSFDLETESIRLNKIMNDYDCVNIFLSEGAGIDNIVKEKEKNNQIIKRDAFGHIRLDELNPGKWYASYFKKHLKADKVLVQKSGYFSRSAAPNSKDLELIFSHADFAVKQAMLGNSGVVGIDEKEDDISCINFSRIKGHKPFNISLDWYIDLKKQIGQRK